MQNRKRHTYSFRVPIEMIDGTRRWLGPEGDLVEEDASVEFTFHRSPTGLERNSMDRECHRILGEGDEGRGLRAWADLLAGMEATTNAAYNRVASEVWPDGRPELAKDDKEGFRAQQKALGAAFNVSTCPEKRAWASLRDQVDRVLWMARWNVLAVSVPPFYADLSAVEMEDEGLWTLLETAWHEAREKAAEDSGKQQPSAS